MTTTPNTPQWPEKRMDNIGQNGNDGEHYNQLSCPSCPQQEYEITRPGIISYWPEERMDNIGQNGNDGEHYERPVNANDILKAAAGHMQDRAATYDKPAGERSMAKAVAMFNIYADTNLTEEQGWQFMSILKKIRSQQGAYRADNYEDDTAYSSLAGEAAARNHKEVPHEA